VILPTPVRSGLSASVGGTFSSRHLADSCLETAMQLTPETIVATLTAVTSLTLAIATLVRAFRASPTAALAA
jgi:hypothetical protein